MTLWTQSDADEATGGRSTGSWQADGISIDTRSLKPGDLFVALKDQRDGHDFVADAFARGAAAAMVSRIPGDCPPGVALLVVDDVLAGLEALARAARARTAARVVAVTGSVGKTGTKEMLRTALSGAGSVHAAEKSYNNHWGVPLTLARMPRQTAFAVIEIGMNHPGEIEPLARLARPNAAIVTTVAPVHMAAFRTLRDIAREKAAIFSGLEPGGTAIINRDQPHYATMLLQARKHAAAVVRFGAGGRPEFRLESARLAPDTTTVKASVRGEQILFKLGSPGRHLALNALAVLAACEAVGVDVAEAALELAQWHTPEGRGAIWDVVRGVEGLDGSFQLIDDSYNANPLSMAAALDVLVAARPQNGMGRIARGRRIAILGDMLELGPDEMQMHADLATLPAIADIDLIHCIGPRMQALYAALPPQKRGRWTESADTFAKTVGQCVDDGDVVLVKGSNGSRVGRIVEAIKRLGLCRPRGNYEGDA